MAIDRKGYVGPMSEEIVMQQAEMLDLKRHIALVENKEEMARFKSAEAYRDYLEGLYNRLSYLNSRVTSAHR